jgi:hypothetical protein
MITPSPEQQRDLSPITDTLGRVWTYNGYDWQPLETDDFVPQSFEDLIEHLPLPDSERTRVDTFLHDLEDAARLDALSQGRTIALSTADYWAEIAETLTGIRRSAILCLPELPDGHEEWWDRSGPDLPFDHEQLRDQLGALSNLITKAHTIAVIYGQCAAHLIEEYAAVAPD